MLRWVSMTFLGAKWRCCIVILINLITFVICQLAMCWGSVCGKGWCRHRRLTIFYSYLLSSCQLANCAQMCIENYEKRSQVQIVSIPKFRSNSNSICIIQHTHISHTYIHMYEAFSVCSHDIDLDNARRSTSYASDWRIGVVWVTRALSSGLLRGRKLLGLLKLVFAFSIGRQLQARNMRMPRATASAGTTTATHTVKLTHWQTNYSLWFLAETGCGVALLHICVR